MNIGTVIVLFHPQVAQLTAMIETLTACDTPIVLVDNSPVPLRLTLPESVSYLHFPANVGIAAAQNRGIEYLIKKGCNGSLIFDQDSQVNADFIVDMVSAFIKAKNSFERVAAIGPSIICEFNNAPVAPRLQKPLEISDDLASVRQIIASGMLLDHSAFNQVGAKEEALFIDGVDHEWCWRARDKGFHIIQAQSVKMLHRQGDARHRILGLNFKQGAPVRLYYQVRNMLILSRRDYVPLYWKLRHLPALPLRWLVNRWWFPEGKLRSHYFRKGLLHGISKRQGKIES